MAVWNETGPISIQPGTLVSGINKTQVTLSKPLQGPGVLWGDDIKFITNPGWFQDAVTYAITNGYQLIARGQGPRLYNDDMGPTKIRITDGPLYVPPSLFPPYLDLRCVQMEITGPNGIVRDSAELGTFYWPLIIAYHGDGAAMVWEPTLQTPVDQLRGFSDNEERFGAVVVQGGALTAKCFLIKTSLGTFSDNRIVWKELFGLRRVQEGSGFSDTLFEIEDAAPTTYFRHNIFVGNQAHGFTGQAIKEGSSTTNQANMHDNQWQVAKIAPAPGATAAIGLKSYGSYETWFAGVSNDEMAPGETFVASAVLNGNRNRAFINDVGAANPIINSGTFNLIHRNGSFASVSIGSNPAVGDALGLDNNRYIAARNAAGTGNVALWKIDAADVHTIGTLRAPATVPANFSADFWIQIHDDAGNNFYLPGKGAAW